jgi:hypothetical protein
MHLTMMQDDSGNSTCKCNAKTYYEQVGLWYLEHSGDATLVAMISNDIT